MTPPNAASAILICLRAHAKPVRDGERGRRVQRVVMTGHRHDDVVKYGPGAALAVANNCCKARDAIAEIESSEPDIGVRIFPIGDDAPVLDLGRKLSHDRMVEAHDRETIEGNVFDERAKRFLDRREGSEMIEVFGIDIGDDRYISRKLEESAIAFVGLDHHPIAVAKPRIGSVGVDDAAIDNGRIEFSGLQQGRNERCGGCLSVCPGDGDASFEAHELGEHFGAANDGYAPLPRARRARDSRA